MSWSGREALPDVRKWSGCPTGYPGVVERPFRMSAVVGKPSRMSGRPSQKSGSVRKALPNDRKTLLDIREWSGESPG